MSHDGPGPDHRPIDDSHGKDGRVGPDRYMVSNERGHPKLAISLCWAPGFVGVIDEHDAVRDHCVITNLDQLADESVRLDLTKTPDASPALNFNERADEGSLANGAAVEIHRLHHRDVRTKLHIGDAGSPDVRLFTHDRPRRECARLRARGPAL